MRRSGKVLKMASDIVREGVFGMSCLHSAQTSLQVPFFQKTMLLVMMRFHFAQTLTMLCPCSHQQALWPEFCASRPGLPVALQPVQLLQVSNRGGGSQATARIWRSVPETKSA